MRTIGKHVMCTAQASRNNTTYTASVPFNRCGGDVGLLVTATEANTYAITQQVSDDNLTWYDPKDASNGALGAVASSTTAAIATRWVSIALRQAPYTRFKIVESANAAAGLVTIVMFPIEEY